MLTWREQIRYSSISKVQESQKYLRKTIAHVSSAVFSVCSFYSHTHFALQNPPSQHLRNPKFFFQTFLLVVKLNRTMMAERVSIWFLFVFALSLIVSLPSQISADESESKEFVLTLDHSNFSDSVSKHNFIVVEFYAPWFVSIPPFVSVVVPICTILFHSIVDLTFANSFVLILHWSRFKLF